MKKLFIFIMVIAFLFALAIPCFAYSTDVPEGCPNDFPRLDFPDSVGRVESVFLYQNYAGEYCAITFSHSDFYVEYDNYAFYRQNSNYQYFDITNNSTSALEVHRVIYKNGKWGNYASSTLKGGSTDEFVIESISESNRGGFGSPQDVTPYYTDVTVFYADEVIKYYDTQVFLKAPSLLHQEVLMVVQQAIPHLQMEVGGAIQILVVCGVGLIALLMVLKIFGKASSIFGIR